MIEIRVKRIDNGKLPQWTNLEDAGLDLYANVDIEIPPTAVRLVPLGIATEFPPTFVGLLKDRSGLAAKGLHLFGGVIDSSYRGEWKTVIFNTTSNVYSIRRYDKICQVIFCSIFHLSVTEVNRIEDLRPSRREGKGFGSSGL